MQDILPLDVHVWQHIESAARGAFSTYGYSEIRTPILEYTGVFARGIGEGTDIVEKEMYTFQDKGERSVTMRPEGTASVVRAVIERNLLNEMPTPLKLFYMGPMFRYERPQKGRQRQFHQIGVEAFGEKGPAIDAETIAMLMGLLGRVGLKSVDLQINSIGCPGCRPDFRRALIDFFSAKSEGLCPDCQRRLGSNPLRVLDCKVPRCIELKKGAPSVLDHLCGDCDVHFKGLRQHLDDLKIAYKINPEMVRGLDYYVRTTFEVTSNDLGAQSAVAAGGRYDLLVKEFGGPDTPALGFALGMERLVMLLRDGAAQQPTPDAFIATIGEAALREGMKLAEALRAEGLWIEVGHSGSMKNQMRRADRLKARYAVVIGDDELAKGEANCKELSTGQSRLVPFKALSKEISGS